MEPRARQGLTKLRKEITSCSFWHHFCHDNQIFYCAGLDRVLDHRNSKRVSLPDSQSAIAVKKIGK
jgi:hypothetical protein